MYYYYSNGNFSFYCELKFSSISRKIFIEQDNESKTPSFPIGQKTYKHIDCLLSTLQLLLSTWVARM